MTMFGDQSSYISRVHKHNRKAILELIILRTISFFRRECSHLLGGIRHYALVILIFHDREIREICEICDSIFSVAV